MRKELWTLVGIHTASLAPNKEDVSNDTNQSQFLKITAEQDTKHTRHWSQGAWCTTDKELRMTVLRSGPWFFFSWQLKDEKLATSAEMNVPIFRAEQDPCYRTFVYLSYSFPKIQQFKNLSVKLC